MPAISTSLSHVFAYNQPDCILPKSFFEGRFVPDFHPESLDYEQWWEEQIYRCENGWKDGGHSVTGPNYYHLNFKNINMIVDLKHGDVGANHPYFSYEDQELFNEARECKLNGEGMMLITGRGFGKSFFVSSLVEHEFTFKEVTEIIVSASTERFVDLLWDKIEMGLNSQPDEIRRDLLVDTPLEKQSGYSEQDYATKKWKKYDENAFIRKVTYDSDPEKTRGTRPSIHVFEEIGSWTGAASLLDCWKKTTPSWRRGRFTTTFPIFIGTGGAMDTGGSIDAKMMFEDPKSYGLRQYMWEDKPIAKFYPAYKKYTGCYEDSGVSQDDMAKGILEEERAEKKTNSEQYRQFTSEFPFNPSEAFQTSGTGVFPMDILEKQYVRVERDPVLKKSVQRGNLVWVKDGHKITGVKWEQDEEGVFEIIEHPEWTKKGWEKGKVDNLYIAGCDSFDAVAEANPKGKKKLSSEEKRVKKSRGANFIFKRFYNAMTTGRIFVARIVQRTDDATDFYWNTIKLNLYYNAKVLIEYTKIGIIQHYITQGFEYMLYKRPVLDKTVVKESVSTNTYGVAMPDQVKSHVISLLVKYVKEPGNVEQILFSSFLRDMMQFTFEGRQKNEHDETMGAAICMLADDDMHKIAVKDADSSVGGFPVWQRDIYGRLVFK